MADPAQNLTPDTATNDTGAGDDQASIEIREHPTQVTSVSVNGSTSSSGSSGGSIGPSVASNDNAVANDNGSKGSTQGPATAPSSTPSATPPQSSTGTAGSSPQSATSSGPNAATDTTGGPNADSATSDEADNGAESKKAKENKEEKKEDSKDDGNENNEEKKDTDKAEKGEDPKNNEGQDVKPNEQVPPSEGTTEGKTEATPSPVDDQVNPETQAKETAGQQPSSAPQTPSVPGQGGTPDAKQPVQPVAIQPTAPSPAQPRPAVGRKNPLRSNTATPQPAGAPKPGGVSSSSAPSQGGAKSGGASQKGGALAEKAASKLQNKMHDMAERQRADEKSGKVEQDEMTQGPGLKAKGSGSLAANIANDANIEKQAAEAAARRAGALAGGMGASKKTQQNITVSLLVILNVVFMVLEVASGIGTLVFIGHIVIFLYWLFSKERWKHSWLALVAVLAMPALSILGLIAGFCIVIFGTAFIACHQMSEAIPFGIPINWVTSVGSAFGANFGPFAQVCDLINVHSSGVGGTTTSHTASSTAPNAGTTHAVGTINGQVVLVDDNGQTLTPVIAGTQLVHPQPLPRELATQGNQAGYVSPASCKLGDIPYSEGVTTRRVQLDNGQTKLVALPIHKTIDCIQNDATKTSVRSVQLGRVVRRVRDDSVLGNYVTIEYPNGLRVSYYHLTDIPESLTLGGVMNAGQKVGTMGKTGQITFVGTQMLFELKDNNGSWQTFNPIRDAGESSILTIFPCARADATGETKCLLE